MPDLGKHEAHETYSPVVGGHRCGAVPRTGDAAGRARRAAMDGRRRGTPPGADARDGGQRGARQPLVERAHRRGQPDRLGPAGAEDAARGPHGRHTQPARPRRPAHTHRQRPVVRPPRQPLQGMPRMPPELPVPHRRPCLEGHHPAHAARPAHHATARPTGRHPLGRLAPPDRPQPHGATERPHGGLGQPARPTAGRLRGPRPVRPLAALRFGGQRPRGAADGPGTGVA